MKKGALIIFFTVLIDQVTKHLAKALIPPLLVGSSENIVWIPYLLELSYHENTGASLGILKDQQFLFMIITVIALGIFGYLFLESDFKHKKVYSLSIAFFIGGTLGNAIDRALFGYVIDFLHYPFINPIATFYNNFADLFLSAAIVLFAIDLFIFDPKRQKEGKNHVEIDH